MKNIGVCKIPNSQAKQKDDFHLSSSHLFFFSSSSQHISSRLRLGHDNFYGWFFKKKLYLNYISIQRLS